MWISKKNFEKMRDEAFKAGRKDLESRNKALWESCNKLDSEKIELQKKHEELVLKLRTQSENDMIAEAAKLIFKGIAGEKKEVLQPYYQSMLAAQQNMNMYSGQGGLLSSIGGIWGGVPGR